MNKAASLYIDVLRLVAALVVFVVHAHYLLPGSLPGLWRLASLGGEAVTVFFVLSGFVIAHVVETREKHASDYLASRFARLYSVVLPALALTALLELAGAALAPRAYANSLEQVAGFPASLLFVNELWFTSRPPPSNTPFWSLGYEFWYYLIYAAQRYMPGRRARWAAVAGLGLLCGPKILLLLPVWQLGVLAYAIVDSKRLRPGMVAALCALASAAGLYLLVASGAKAQWHAATSAMLGPTALDLGPSGHVLYTYAFGLLTTIHLVAMVTLAPLFGHLWRLGEHAIRISSAQTFAIYLFHYPLLKFLVAVTASVGALRGPVVITLTLLVIASLGSASDRLKPGLKRWFRARLTALAGGGWFRLTRKWI